MTRILGMPVFAASSFMARNFSTSGFTLPGLQYMISRISIMVRVSVRSGMRACPANLRPGGDTRKAAPPREGAASWASGPVQRYCDLTLPQLVPTTGVEQYADGAGPIRVECELIWSHESWKKS